MRYLRETCENLHRLLRPGSWSIMTTAAVKSGAPSRPIMDIWLHHPVFSLRHPSYHVLTKVFQKLPFPTSYKTQELPLRLWHHINRHRIARAIYQLLRAAGSEGRALSLRTSIPTDTGPAMVQSVTAQIITRKISSPFSSTPVPSRCWSCSVPELWESEAIK